LHGFSRQKAKKEDQQAQTPEDAKEDTLAASAQVIFGDRIGTAAKRSQIHCDH
jgi:hypothetical protein